MLYVWLCVWLRVGRLRVPVGLSPFHSPHTECCARRAGAAPRAGRARLRALASSDLSRVMYVSALTR